jgi:hypothetical protein
VLVVLGGVVAALVLVAGVLVVLERVRGPLS